MERRRRRILSGVLAVLLVVALAVGLMPNKQVYAAEKTSDGNTTGSYEQNLGGNSSTRYAGRVWTDKTVYTENATFTGDEGSVTVENDSDFLVAYSALATTQNVTGKSSVPVDVVFVIDNSNSMDNSVGGGSRQSRLEATVEAVNTSIATIMESHPDSRVAVVLYGSSAHTLMSLGHYSASTSWQHNGDYIWYESDTYYSGYYGRYVTDTTFGSVTNNRELEMTYGERGTNIHSGVDIGMDILKGATNIGEGASKHVPALVLLSDGAATYAGSGNWWDPSGSQGIGSEPSVTFSLETAMHAQYQKQLVNNHYGVDADADTSCKIYTIGMGIEQLSGSERNIARLALNPGTYITGNNDEANAMETAWNSYLRGQNPTMRYPADTDSWGDIEYSNYTFRHPSSGDISTIAYNDGYYSAENAEDVTNVFDDITSEIVSASAQAPTHIEGDPLESGYLTYTDPIGEYMEVKDIKSIIYGGKEFTQKSSSTDGNTTTYTFEGATIESPVYGELDVSSIIISVTKDDNGNETLTVKIPAAAIPLRVNTVDIDENGAITNTNNNAYPARILYTVGAREGVDLDTLKGVSDDYISANMTEDGQKVNFYSNKYSGNKQNEKTVGDATVTLTPAETNPFFYVQENTPLYTAENTNFPARSIQDDNTLYYFQITYYEGNEEKTEWVSRPGSSFWHNGSTDATITTLDSGQVAIKQGAPRLGYLTDFAQTKSENTTNTAEQVFHPVYDGNGQFTVYLGNNGVLKANAPKSLTVEKDVAAGEGLTAPDAEFTFEVTVATKADTTGDAILTDAEGQTTDKELIFDADGKTTFTLKDGQSMEILNIGEGVDYTVKEINLPAGFTSDQADNTKTGIVSGTDEDNVVTFTNTYNVTEVTTADLGITLGGTKSITGRDFQADDEFVFTIAPAQATPNAPLPTEDTDQDGSATTATVNPTSGEEVSFEFGNVTFDKPGEYRYVIRETTGTLPGVDYDGALYRVNIIVKDNGDGTLSLASVDGGLTGAGNVNYPTNPFIQVWDGDQAGVVVGAVAFENHYSATSAEATIQGMKVLNSINSDRILADNDFTFTIEALGYNTDGGDQFNQVPAGDPEQPMPATTEVNNVANGNVIFGEMTFTQDMIGNTYGYKITENLPQGVDENNPTLNGMTYDTSEKIVKVTVTRSDEGGEEHVVATVTPNDGTAEAAKNFTFTNTYEPSSITIGDDTDDAITVQKTFTGRTWNDSDEFKYTLNALDDAPAPDQTTLSIGKPASGTSNTAMFGDITFVKEGVYKYEITETKGNLGGVDYDEHTATVTVTVTENEAAGTLSAEVSYDNSKAENDSDRAVTNAAAFTNTYKATFDTRTTVNLNGTKELTGKDLTDSAFYFIVDPQETASGGYAPTGESVAWNPNKADGSIQLLKNVTYTEAGEYVYIIREQIPSNKALGMTYDESEYRVTVTVTDDQQGNLTASEPKIEKKEAGAADYTEVDAVKFENSYEPLSGTYAPREITKVLDGDRETPLQEGEFSFEMSVVSAEPEDGITLPQETTVANDANGKVKFGDITFTKVGKYVVQVKEIVPADEADKVDGVTYSTNVIKTTFDVRDEDGQLKAYVTGTDGSLTFTNTYTPEEVTTTNDILVTKEVTGAPATEGFTFSLNLAEGQDGSSVFEGTGDNKTAFNGVEVTTSDKIAAGDKETKAFAGVTFTKAGDYKFVIDETTTTDKQGWTYDDKTVEITVHVEDQDSKLVITGVDNNNPTFTNKYVPNGVTVGDDEAGLQATKQVTGAPATEEFEFALTLTSNNAANVEGLGENNSIVKSTTGLTGKEDETETIDFGDLTFTAEGVYTFVVTENTTTDAEGWTYGSGSGAVITVTVTDEGYDGQLDATTMVEVEGEQVDTNNPTIVNSYEPGSVTVGEGEASGPIQVTKKIEGTAPAAEDFNFTLTFTPDADGNTGKAENIKGLTNNALTTSVSKESLVDDNTETVSFGKLTFTEEGDYYFTVAETNQAAENCGWTYDNTGKTVIVHVTDTDHDGYLEATVDNDAAVVTNKYKADSITIGEDTQAGIQVQKTLAGRDWQDKDSFEFILEAVDNAPMPADDGNKVTITNESENKNAAFGSITYDTAGEYQYTIKETTGSINGVTYDTHTANVTVTITDEDYDGALELKSIVYDNNTEGAEDADKAITNIAAFTNTYDAASTGDTVPAGFTLTKEFTGHEWTEDYAFEFIMSPKSGTLADGTEATEIPMPKADENAGVTIDDDGNAHKTISGPQEGTTANFDFGNITYDKAGTYVYEVKEAKAGTTDKGVTYSGNTATITVRVTDKDASGVSTGKLVATASIEGDTFTNTYEANADYDADGAGGLDITKKLNNRNMTADQFTFTIEATGDNAADAAKKLGITDGTTTTVKNNDGAAGAAVSVVGNPFEKMTFDETDNGKTYTYTIKENGTSGEGDYAGYKLDDTTYTVSITATDKGDGTMTVKTVVNDGTADKEYTNQRATVAFENTYDAGDVTVGAKGDAQIVANKTLKNDDIASYDGKFKFQVTSGDVVVAEGTNDKNGNITFGDITYTTENLAAAATAEGSDTVGKANLDTKGETDVYTFNYSVSEVTTGLPGGVTYGDGDTNVTVTVTDDRHGKLNVEVGYADGASSVEFVNTYGKDGKAELNLKGNKEIVPGEGLTEAPALVDDTYTFEITGNAAEDGTPAPMPEKTTATNKSGAVEFGTITFTMENVFGTTPTTQDVTVEEEQKAEETTVEGETEEATDEETTEGETVTAGVTNADEGIELQTAGRTKTFTYTIKETEGSVPGVDNDTTVKTVTVTVKDEGDGKISVVATPDKGADEGNDFTFTNVYNVDPKDSSLTGDGGFKITKTLTGRDMAQGEFAFRLKEQNGDWWTAPTNPAAADGEAAEITFGAVHFTKPGKYTYTLEEEQGNLAGVEYDSNKYTVIATVTDKDAEGNYTGELEVTWQINGAADNIVAFKNTYTADPTSVSLGAGKLIKGRDLKAGEFSFLLTDADGKEINTAKNEENGAVTFKTITFDKAGTYSYEIREVLPEDDDSKTDGIQSSNVTYDENIYHVTVDVKDNTEKGCLEATVTYKDSDGAPVFVNTYTEPADDGDDVGIFGVKTGDPAETAILLTIMGVALAVIVAMSMILIRRHRR